MSHTWLQKQKKQELIDLATEIGHSLEDGLKKDEIVENLQDFLQNNATRLSKNTLLEGFYGGRRTPFKAPSSDDLVSSDEPEVTEVKSVVKGRGRRATRIKQEPTDDSDYASPTTIAKNTASAISTAVLSPFSHNAQASSARTPATIRRSTRQRSVVPASPADIADLAEYESRALFDRISDFYERAGVAENIEYLRDSCSSVPAVHLTFGALEAFALLYHLMPMKYYFDIPAIAALHTPSVAVRLPDLFILLTSYWWSTTLLWASTSILVPLLFGYFYNLTVRNVGRGHTRKYTIDPLTFSVVKGVATWLVYCKAVSFAGIIDPDVAERVDASILGGHTAVLVGCGISALASLYEAAQKK